MGAHIIIVKQGIFRSEWNAADFPQKEAVPIENNEHRNIRRPDGTGSSSGTGGQGRKLNRTGSSGRPAPAARSAGASHGQAPGRQSSGAQGGQRRPAGQSGPARISSSPRRRPGEAQPGHSAPPPQGGAPRKKQGRGMRIFKGFMKFVGVCICLGIMAGSVLAVVLSMYVVKITAGDADLLDLTNLKLALTTKIMCPDPDTGEPIEYASLHSENNREWVDLQEIESNPYLKWAFICVEDKDFYSHHGVNIKRTIGAALNEFGLPLYSSRQGASTLDQQLIKNITDDDEQSIERKVREIFRAFGLDNRYEKDTILEAYLNTISLTGTVAGVQAGASEYFNIENLADLSAAQCASIAAITKNPTAYNPYTNPEQHLQRRNWILKLMHDQGKLGDQEYEAARTAPLVLAEEAEKEMVTHTSNNSYFTDAVFEAVTEQLMADRGLTEKEAHSLIYNGGLRIYATVNPFIQQEMEKIMLNADDAIPALWREEKVAAQTNTGEDIDPTTIENIVTNEDGTYKTGTDSDGSPVYYRKVRTQAAMLTMDYEGKVLALVGGLGQKNEDLGLNRAILNDHPRQTGSTMKPIAAYALGIDSGLINYSQAFPDYGIGMMLQSELNGRYPQLAGQLLDFTDPEVLAHPELFNQWPRNYEGFGDGSNVTVRLALAKSRNTIAVRVGQLVGVDYMFSFAKDTVGLSHLLPTDANYAPIVLGAQGGGVTLMELTGAYQMFGNGGEYVTPHLYTRVEYATTGEVLIDNEINVTHTQAIQPSTAMIMNKLLQNVLGADGTAGTSIKPAGDMEAAAKTGTTTDNKDYTFVGMTPYYVTGVWWGFDQPFDMTKAGAAGKNAKPIQKAWKQFMDAIQADLEFKAFPSSDDVVKATYCDDSGDLAGPNCPSPRTGYYTQDNMPEYCTLHP